MIVGGKVLTVIINPWIGFVLNVNAITRYNNFNTSTLNKYLFSMFSLVLLYGQHVVKL